MHGYMLQHICGSCAAASHSSTAAHCRMRTACTLLAESTTATGVRQMQQPAIASAHTILLARAGTACSSCKWPAGASTRRQQRRQPLAPSTASAQALTTHCMYSTCTVT